MLAWRRSVAAVLWLLASTGGGLASRLPLFLTPYLEAGDLGEAATASRVPFLADKYPSYSGYLTVNKTLNANIFFWLFKSEVGWDAPLLVHLGGSAAALEAVGPVRVAGDGSGAEERARGRWTEAGHLLALDAPLGMGLSKADNPWALPDSAEAVAQQLHQAIQQVVQLFPQLANRQVFLAGDWVMSKAAVALGRRMSAAGAPPAGLILTGPYFGPEQLKGYAEHFYQTGLVDTLGKARLEEAEDKVAEALRSEGPEACWRAAEGLWSALVSESGLSWLNNLVQATPPPRPSLDQFFADPAARDALHLGDWATFNQNDTSAIDQRLKFDHCRSAGPWLEELLESGCRALVVSGQLDLVSPGPGTAAFLRGLDWAGKGEFLAGPRRIWEAEGTLAGYSREGGRLSELFLRDVGHTPAFGRPLVFLDALKRFIAGRSLHG